MNSDLCDLELRDNIVVYMDFPTLVCNVSLLWGSHVSVLGFLLLPRVLRFVQTVKLIYRKQTPLGFERN